ncbi:MAG: hypothetical protein NT066_06975, partial [Candidatus Omnitrophica bacterium]|nr:hypothetical protein [Candidatus Omnitrophota bacterium]
MVCAEVGTAFIKDGAFVYFVREPGSLIVKRGFLVTDIPVQITGRESLRFKGGKVRINIPIHVVPKDSLALFEVYAKDAPSKPLCRVETYNSRIMLTPDRYSSLRGAWIKEVNGGYVIETIDRSETRVPLPYVATLLKEGTVWNLRLWPRDHSDENTALSITQIDNDKFSFEELMGMIDNAKVWQLLYGGAASPVEKAHTVSSPVDITRSLGEIHKGSVDLSVPRWKELKSGSALPSVAGGKYLAAVQRGVAGGDRSNNPAADKSSSPVDESSGPAQREIDRAVKKAGLTNFDVIKETSLFSELTNILETIGLYKAARLLQELSSRGYVRAPPQELINRNPPLKKIFEKVSYLVYLDEQNQPYILISPRLLANHPEFIFAIVSGAVEIYLRNEGLDREVVQKQSAELAWLLKKIPDIKEDYSVGIRHITDSIERQEPSRDVYYDHRLDKMRISWYWPCVYLATVLADAQVKARLAAGEVLDYLMRNPGIDNPETEVSVDFLDELVKQYELDEEQQGDLYTVLSPLFIGINRMDATIEAIARGELVGLDLIIVTVVNKGLERYLQRHFDALAGALYNPNKTRIRVKAISQEFGDFLAGLHTMDLYFRGEFGQVKDTDKVLIIPTAGAGKRDYPITAACKGNKGLLWVPREMKGMPLFYVDQVILQFYQVLKDSPEGTFTVGACDQSWVVGARVADTRHSLQVYGSPKVFVKELIRAGCLKERDFQHGVVQVSVTPKLIRSVVSAIEQGKCPMIKSLFNLGNIKQQADRAEITNMFEKILKIKNNNLYEAVKLFLEEFLAEGLASANWWNHRLKFKSARDGIAIFKEELKAIEQGSLSLRDWGLSKLLLMAYVMNEELWASYTNAEAQHRYLYKKAQSMIYALGNRIGYLDTKGAFEDTGIVENLHRVFANAYYVPLYRRLFGMKSNVIASPQVQRAIERGDIVVEPGARVVFVYSDMERGHFPSGCEIPVVDCIVKEVKTSEGSALLWGLRGRAQKVLVSPGSLVCDVYLGRYGYRRFVLSLHIDPEAFWGTEVFFAFPFERIQRMVLEIAPEEIDKARQDYLDGILKPIAPAEKEITLPTLPHFHIVLPGEITLVGGSRGEVTPIIDELMDAYKLQFKGLVHALGLAPTATAKEIKERLYELMQRIEGGLGRFVCPGDLSTPEGTQEFANAILNRFGRPLVITLDSSVVRQILLQRPTLELQESGRDVAAVLSGMTDYCYCLARSLWTEDAEWRRTYRRGVMDWIKNNVEPEGFRVQPLEVDIFRWKHPKQFSLYEHLSLLDRITAIFLITPVPEGRGGMFVRLRLFTRVLKAIIQIQRFHDIWQGFFEENPDTFVKHWVDSINSYEQLCDIELNGHWLLEGYVQRKLKDALSKLAEELKTQEASREFAQDLSIAAEHYGLSMVWKESVPTPKGIETFIPCSLWTWASSFSKGTAQRLRQEQIGVSHPDLARVEFASCLLDLVELYLKAIGSTFTPEDYVKNTLREGTAHKRISLPSSASGLFGTRDEESKSSSPITHNIRSLRDRTGLRHLAVAGGGHRVLSPAAAAGLISSSPAGVARPVAIGKWKTQVTALAHIRSVLHEKLPKFMAAYERWDGKNKEEEAQILQQILAFTTDDFISLGLKSAFDRRSTPYFRGSFFTMLQLVFERLPLPLPKKNFRMVAKRQVLPEAAVSEDPTGFVAVLEEALAAANNKHPAYFRGSSIDLAEIAWRLHSLRLSLNNGIYELGGPEKAV